MKQLLRYQRVHSLGEKVLIWMCNINIDHCCCCSVTKSCLTLQPRGLQHSRLTCPPLSPRVCSSSCLLSWWCYLSISSSATLFSFCLQSFPASGSESFLKSRVFASSGQSIGASASVLSMNIQGWFPLGLTGWWSLPYPKFIKLTWTGTLKSTWNHASMGWNGNYREIMGRFRMLLL